MKQKPKTYCRLHSNGAIDQPCKDQCVSCGVAHLKDNEIQEIQSEVDINSVNAYTCGSCAKNTVVKHRDKGVAPFFIKCIHCGNDAISHMYKVPQDLEHDLVAFKPNSKAEWKLYSKYLKAWYNDPTMPTKDFNKAMAAVKQHVKSGAVVFVSEDKLKI
jgi:hypothetical protein